MTKISQTPNKKIRPTVEEQKEKNESLSNSIKIILAIFILKTKSNKDNPMRASVLVKSLGSFTIYDVGDANARRLGDSLEVISALQKNGADSLKLALGGSVVLATKPPKKTSNENIKGDTRWFYFEPLLSESDTNLLNSLIISERHLSNNLKDFLHERITALNPYPYQAFSNLEERVSENVKPFFSTKRNRTVGEEIEKYRDDLRLEILKKTDKPSKSRQNDLSCIRESHAVDFIDQIQNIQKLYTAIKEKYKIKITYGRLKFDDQKHGRPMFSINLEEDKPKEYFLSPYALAWSGGHYYLINKKDNKPDLSAYRVDRIKTVDFCEIPNSEKKKKSGKIYEEREDLPEKYSMFKKGNGTKGFIFDVDKFLTTFPLMITGGSKKKIEEDTVERKQDSSCQFNLVISSKILCNNIGYSILVDFFGDKLHGEENTTDIKQTRELRDYSYCLTLKNVGEDALVRLCANYHSAMTLIEPAHLVERVRDEIKKSLDLYDKVQASK